MQVINKVQERYDAEARETETREKRRRAREALLRAEKAKPTGLSIDAGAWNLFLKVLQNGAMLRVYGNTIAGAFFYHDQVTAADRFLTIAIRDRQQLPELVLEEFDRRRIKAALTLPTDPIIVDTLTEEAGGIGIDYETYLRALFYSRLYQISEEHERFNEEQAREQWDNRPVRTEGVIHAELRKRLEGKYGMPEMWDPLWGTPKSGYFNLLIKVAEEYFGLNVKEGTNR